jgi:hypothetical protein
MSAAPDGHEPSCRCAGVRRRRARVGVFVDRGYKVLGHVLWTNVLVSALLAVGTWWTWRQTLTAWVVGLLVSLGGVGALAVLSVATGADVDDRTDG